MKKLIWIVLVLLLIGSGTLYAQETPVLDYVVYLPFVSNQSEPGALPTITPTPTPSPTQTFTPTPEVPPTATISTGNETLTPTSTQTPLPIVTNTPTPTLIPTQTPEPTATFTPTPTNTPPPPPTPRPSPTTGPTPTPTLVPIRVYIINRVDRCVYYSVRDETGYYTQFGGAVCFIFDHYPHEISTIKRGLHYIYVEPAWPGCGDGQPWVIWEQHLIEEDVVFVFECVGDEFVFSVVPLSDW